MNRIKKLALPFALGGLALSGPVLAHGKNHHQHDAMFDQMDKNNDGKISAEEHAAGAKKMFDKMDANNDGRVTEDEMTAYIAEKKEARAAKDSDKDRDKDRDRDRGEELSAKDKIKEIDTNGDGFLTAVEHRDGSKKMFEKMDTDRDGFLTRSEWDAGHQKLMKKPGA
jgi:Ca2+-binding EF-hand superfamily protein